GGSRHRVVHVAAGDELAILVVDAVLEQRLPDTVHNATVHLSFDDHRVDHVAKVVAGREPVDADDSGGGIDLDFADVGAGRIGEVGRVVEGVLVQSRLQFVVRVVVWHVGRQ